ncbi:MAG: hypothetical protein M3O65_02380 [Actinomycetota bacterium]|nr:hypothetical protein [Actinomycetota bacterium]
MTREPDGQEFHPSTTFPQHHVVAVVDDLDAAKQAVQAFVDAGVTADDLHLFPSQEFLSMVSETHEQADRVQAMVHRLSVSSSEGFAGDWYMEAARNGGNILAVHARGDEQVERARALLADANAYGIRYFGRLAITDLPS